VGLHLHRMKLSGQTPCDRAQERNPEEVADFLEVKFPIIQPLAEKIGADIAVEDEAGVGIMNRSGHTGGAVGQAPKVAITGRRGGYNGLSTITANGERYWALEEKSLDGKRYVEFLENLLRDRTRPLIVIADNVSFHKAPSTLSDYRQVFDL